MDDERWVPGAGRREGALPASGAGLVAVVQSAERFVAAIETRAIALMFKLELTMPELRTVMTIRRLGRANGRQLAAALGVTPAAVVGIGDKLESRGYLRRIADAHDRRITWFELTDVGTAAVKSSPAIGRARSQMKALVAGLTPCEREGFVKVADAFAAALGSALHTDNEHDPAASVARS
jgi:DNA-binding MarR family transcriptional regulator